jgi:hypothetical protein
LGSQSAAIFESHFSSVDRHNISWSAGCHLSNVHSLLMH